MVANEVPTRSESEIYDRQIRLWGADAQAKISKARVLYINLTGVSQEILKNLVLAGVRASLCDSRPYPDAVQTTASFFLLDREDNAKKPKFSSVAHSLQEAVEELNPLLGKCEIVDKSVQELLEDDNLVSQYGMVVASRIGMDDAGRLASATTKSGGKFYLVDSFGFNSASVLDLGSNHTYRAEVGKNTVSKDVLTVEHHLPLGEIWKIPLTDLTGRRVDKHHPPIIFMQYRSILEYHAQSGGKWPSEERSDDFVKAIQDWIGNEAPAYATLECFQKETLQEWARTATAEMAPVCAVAGGILGNEVIKAISSKGEPANNALLFEGQTGKCRNVLLKVK